MAAGFALSVLASMGFVVVFWVGGQTQAEGVAAAVAFGGLALGLGLWGTKLLPGGTDVEHRHPLGSSPAERAAVAADFAAGEHEIGRRQVLGGMAVTAAVALGGAALVPLRSLGPRPGSSLRRTGWGAGTRLVTAEGRALKADDLAVGEVVTVFPEGGISPGDSQTLLIRLGPTELRPRPLRADWAPDGHIAFSKICTHAGCPVGLYDAVNHQLVCPCHQSLFDVLDEARPVFGPATRPLPQLPLSIDADGWLVARSDYPEPVGPGFWGRNG